MQKPPVLHDFLLSDPQLAAALARGSDVAVTAGAGTGKTRTLVARYLALLAGGLPLRHIVAVTFTRKAAREMRNRVRQEIGAYLSRPLADSAQRETWQTYYNELDAARIGTIHNLCAEILRTHPAEVGIDPQFTVLDETQSALLLQEAVEAALAWAVETDAVAPLFDLLSEQKLQELITTLLKNRLAALELLGRVPAAGAFAHWQAMLQEAQSAALGRFLVNRDLLAARECLTRSQAHDLDDKAEVQRLMALAALNSLDTESLTGRLRDLAALGRINLAGGSQNSWPGGKEQLADVKAALKRLRDLFRAQPILCQSLNEQDEAFAAAVPAIYALFHHAQGTYQALKEERDGLDFDDLEALAIQLLETHDPVRAYWQSQVGALLVDEFQDTNEHQCRFIRLLCPLPGRLFIVGDAKQSIYHFRGADVAVFAHEKEQIGRQDGNLIDLQTSYRAHESLLKGMNALLRPVLGDPSPDLPPWVAPFAPLQPAVKTPAHDLRPPFIEFHLTMGTKDAAMPRAAAALAARLSRLHSENGLDYGDMAVLCRASGSFHFYENAFDAAGIPYLTVAGKGFYDRPEIRDLLNSLQAIADPHDDLALTGLLRSPACGISDVALYRLARRRPANSTLWDTIQQPIQLDDPQETARLQTAVALIQELNQLAGRTPAADLLKKFLDTTHYRAILRRIEQPRALRNVAKLLNDIHKSELVTVYEFLEYAQTLRDSGTREGEARATAGGALQIMSVHAAKGLEFPIVVLGDAGSGSFRARDIVVDPHLGILFSYKNDAETRAAAYEMWLQLAKEREEAETARLLYVALTRAEQMLFINGTIQQDKNGRISWKGWIKQLAEIIGMSQAELAGVDQEGAARQTFDYTVQETPVRVEFYEPHFPITPAAPLPQTPESAVTQRSPKALQDPVIKVPAPPAEEEDTPQRVWQVVPTTKRPAAPAWVIGALVHQALALWRFPGPGFDVWAASRAQEYGITDKRQLRHARTETARLLVRFQSSPLYHEINSAARRLHELPYTYELDGQTETGRIDLIYLYNGAWTIVDFKTDRVRDQAAIQTLLHEKGYEEQLRQYGTAVSQLLHQTPRLLLCLLNNDQEVHVISIAA